MNHLISTLKCLLVSAVTLFTLNTKDAVAQFVLGTPSRLGPPIATSLQELNAELSSDGLSLYFSRAPSIGAGEGNGSSDLYVATRASVNDPWSEPHPVGAPLNRVGQDEFSPTLTPDGTQLYFANSWRAGDLWESSWDESTSSWSEPQKLAEPINSRYGDWHADFSKDGLSLYFSSNRPGGAGESDIWVAHRDSLDASWGEPTNVSFLNSSGNEDDPTISADGRTLFFVVGGSGHAGGRIHASTRSDLDGQWSPPVDLGDNLNTSRWTVGPDISSDGSTLFFQKFDGQLDLWEVPIQPLEPTSIVPGTIYDQDFDSLPASGDTEAPLPVGWTATSNGLVHEGATTSAFPPRSIADEPVFSAGSDNDSDRALAIGVPRGNSSETLMLQFLGGLGISDAAALQLQFDLEPWLGERRANTPGEAAFDVLVEANSGEGFELLHQFSNISTGVILSPPQGGGIVDGNLDANRTAFDSGPQTAMLPGGSQLRIRWEVPEASDTSGWVFGLDNVKLQLFDNLVDAFDCNGDGVLDVLDANCAPKASLDSTLAAANLIKGDADGDGTVQFADFLTVSSNFGESGQYTDGDFDRNGQVQFEDFLILSSNFGQSVVATSAVPEPSGVLMLGVGLLAPFRRHRQ